MHGHGWKKGILFWTSRYGSIMQTRFVGQREIERTFHFSNPNVENRNKPTGVSGESNNARVFTVNGSVVCAYRGDANPLGVNINGPVTAESGASQSFTARINGGTAPYIYNWFVRSSDGTPIPGGNGTSHTVIMPNEANITVDLLVRDSENRSVLASRFVRNIDAGSDGSGDENPSIFFDEVKDIAVDEIEEVVIFPNPVTDILQIAIPERFEKVQLLEMSGRILETQTLLTTDENLVVRGHLTSFDFTNLAKGIYLVKLTASNQSETYRIIKE